MPRRKDYAFGSTAPHLGSTQESDHTTRRSALDFYEELGVDGRVAGGRGIDLSDWLGHGIDEWVYTCIACMRRLLRGRVAETATLEGRRAGLRTAFQFLSRADAGHIASTPEQLTIAHVRGYYRWLETRWKSGDLKWSSARAYYSQLKSMLGDLYEYGYIASDPEELFRDNFFRGGQGSTESTPSLSSREELSVARALKKDLSDSYHGRLRLRPSELATCKYLVVAMRIGESTVPILELKRTEPKDGVLPGTMILTTDKRRAHKHNQRLIPSKCTVAEDAPSTPSGTSLVVPTDVAAVLRMVIADTESLVSRAPARLKVRVWLYITTRGEGAGRVTALTQAAVQKSVKAIIRRHGLTGDDGKPLQLNTRRLRATFSHHANVATGGDIIQTSGILGNTPRVASSNYLPITEQIKAQGALFVNGLASRLSNKLAGEGKRVPKALVAAVATPLSGCSDPLNGEFAPRDGSNICDKWVMCLFCPQFAIAGDEEELWRLFSFRRFAEHELDRLVKRHGAEASGDERSDLLKELYRLAIPFVGEFAKAHFKERVVHRAALRAQREAHPFWAYQDELAAMRR